MERVSVIKGSLPILLVAPHGFDDDFTAEFTESAAESIDCNAVINRGWERADQVDALKDKANCNSVRQCREDVVREEFLEPIQKIVKKTTASGMGSMMGMPVLNNHLYIFWIHGMGDHYRRSIDPKLDIVLGYGEGKPPRPLCYAWRKDLMTHTLEQAKWTVYQAGSGNSFAAWDRDNMAQLFQGNNKVSSMQLEFVLAHRKNASMATTTGRMFGHTIRNLPNMASWAPPVGWAPKITY